MDLIWTFLWKRWELKLISQLSNSLGKEMITGWSKDRASRRNAQCSRNCCLQSEHNSASQASFYFQNSLSFYIIRIDTIKYFIKSGLWTSINVFKGLDYLTVLIIMRSSIDDLVLWTSSCWPGVSSEPVDVKHFQVLHQLLRDQQIQHPVWFSTSLTLSRATSGSPPIVKTVNGINCIFIIIPAPDSS